MFGGSNTYSPGGPGCLGCSQNGCNFLQGSGWKFHPSHDGNVHFHGRWRAKARTFKGVDGGHRVFHIRAWSRSDIGEKPLQTSEPPRGHIRSSSAILCWSGTSSATNPTDSGCECQHVCTAHVGSHSHVNNSTPSPLPSMSINPMPCFLWGLRSAGPCGWSECCCKFAQQRFSLSGFVGKSHGSSSLVPSLCKRWHSMTFHTKDPGRPHFPTNPQAFNEIKHYERHIPLGIQSPSENGSGT